MVKIVDDPKIDAGPDAAPEAAPAVDINSSKGLQSDNLANLRSQFVADQFKKFDRPAEGPLDTSFDGVAYDEPNQRFLVDINSDRIPDVQIRLDGHITSALIDDLREWHQNNPNASVEDKINITQKLIVMHYGESNQEVALADHLRKPIELAIKRSEQEIKLISERFDGLKFAESYFANTMDDYSPITDAINRETISFSEGVHLDALNSEDRQEYNQLVAKGFQLDSRAFNSIPEHITNPETDGGQELISNEPSGQIRLRELQEKAVQETAKNEAVDFLVKQGSSYQELNTKSSDQIFTMAMKAAHGIMSDVQRETNDLLNKISGLKDQLAQIKIPNIRGENKSFPASLDDMGRDQLVCRHRAPLAHTMLELMGVDSEMVLGSRIDVSGYGSHVFLHVPSINKIYEPTSSYPTAETYPVGTPYRDIDKREVIEIENSVETDGNNTRSLSGYKYDSVSSVSSNRVRHEFDLTLDPNGESLSKQNQRHTERELANLRHRVATENRIDQLLENGALNAEASSMAKRMDAAEQLHYSCYPKITDFFAENHHDLLNPDEAQEVAELQELVSKTDGLIELDTLKRIAHSEELNQRSAYKDRIGEITRVAYNRQQEAEFEAAVDLIMQGSFLDSPELTKEERTALALDEARTMLDKDDNIILNVISGYLKKN